MSFKNMDKLISPAGYFRLCYSLNCVETHRGVFTVVNLTSGKEVFFSLRGLIKSFFPPTLSVRRHFDVPYCAFMLLYLASWVCFSVFFPWFSPLPLPYINSFSFSSVCSWSISCSFSHVVHHIFPLSYPHSFSSSLYHVHPLVTADVITPTAVFYFPSFLSLSSSIISSLMT